MVSLARAHAQKKKYTYLVVNVRELLDDADDTSASSTRRSSTDTDSIRIGAYNSESESVSEKGV